MPSKRRYLSFFVEVEMTYYIYILKCKDNTLYTGIATDVAKRFHQHRLGTGAKYTRGRGPLQLLYVGRAENRSEASKEEARIKKLTRPEKEKLIALGDGDLLLEVREKITSYKK